MGVPSVVLMVVSDVLPVVCKADVAAPVGSETVPAMLLMLLVAPVSCTAKVPALVTAPPEPPPPPPNPVNRPAPPASAITLDADPVWSMQAPKVLEPTVNGTELEAGICTSLTSAVADPIPTVQLTVVVPVFWKITTAPAGNATLADELVAVRLAKFPFGAKPVMDADTEALAHNCPS